MSDDEMEDYGFAYSDDEVAEEDADIENAYYNAKGALEDAGGGDDGARAALSGFQDVLAMDEAGGSRGDWSFKALKQIVKLRHRLGEADAMMAAYADMLGLAAAGAVPRHAAEKKLSSLLDHLAASAASAKGGGGGGGAPAGDGTASTPAPSAGEALLERVYQATLDALGAANERLAFRTRLRLAALWLARGDLAAAEGALAALRAGVGGIPGLDPPSVTGAGTATTAAATQDASSADDARRGTQVLDVLALEVQAAAARGDARRARAAHRAALGALRTAIPHPRVMGAIREAGGRAALADRDWAGAATSFFEAFRAYDEAGAHPQRTACLRGAVVASLLMGTGVDPFEAVEARPYRNDRDVAAVAALADAHQAGDAAAFGRAAARHAAALAADPVVSAHLGDLTAAVRGAAALRAVAPYARVRLDHVAGELGVAPAEAEAVLARLIAAGRLAGRIDQAAGLFEVGGGSGGEDNEEAQATAATAVAGPPDRAASLAGWAGAVRGLHRGVAARLLA